METSPTRISTPKVKHQWRRPKKPYRLKMIWQHIKIQKWTKLAQYRALASHTAPSPTAPESPHRNLMSPYPGGSGGKLQLGQNPCSKFTFASTDYRNTNVIS